MRSSTASFAVRNSAGTSGRNWRMRVSASTPSNPGIMTSSTSTSGRNSLAALTADGPSAATCTLQPVILRPMLMSSDRLGSSSTTRARIGVPSGWVRAGRLLVEKGLAMVPASL
jgi:hypothetical protein